MVSALHDEFHRNTKCVHITDKKQTIDAQKHNFIEISSGKLGSNIKKTRQF